MNYQFLQNKKKLVEDSKSKFYYSRARVVEFWDNFDLKKINSIKEITPQQEKIRSLLNKAYTEFYNGDWFESAETLGLIQHQIDWEASQDLSVAV